MRRRRSYPLRVWVAILACASLLMAAPATEYDVKATFLLRFAEFIDWPPAAFPNPAAPIAICIFGKDPFGRFIDDLVHDEAINGRRLMVRRIDQAPAPQACQIFFTQQSGKEIGGILSSLGPGVLTVGDNDAFVHEGGQIAFFIDSRHVRFDIDQRAAEAAGLKLSSKLLTVARSVHK